MIDKIYPRSLNKDTDQRLLKEGAMIDALDVIYHQSGESTDGVLKNPRGTTAVNASAEVADNIVVNDREIRCIGSLSDSQRGFIYWFIAGVDNDDDDAIYQQDVQANTYRVVYRNDWLNFDQVGFVKAEIVNKNFQQDNDLQSILYFTDNVNPPRKINVDRALAGDYDDLSDYQRDYALNLIKAAPTRVPNATFTTDTSININNFVTTPFQFSTQFIYTDGEESAISGYSRLVAPDVSSTLGLEDSSSGKLFYEDNVCNINLRFSYGSNAAPLNGSVSIPDVEKIRLLSRQGNSGAWIKVDEVDVNENLVREVYGSNVTVYDRDTGVYSWYNDGANPGVSLNDTNKLYDNVPFVAQGLANANNRILLSNYTEGYGNHDPGATISVGYNADRFAASNSNAADSPSFVDNTSNAAPQTYSGDAGYIDVNFLSAGGFSAATDEIPAGSRTTVSFLLDFPDGYFAESAGSNAITFQGTTENGGPIEVGFGEDEATNFRLIPLENTSDFVFQIVVENNQDITAADLPALFVSELEGLTWQKSYTPGTSLRGEELGNSDITFPDPFIITSGLTVNTSWRFDETEIISSGSASSLRIKPYIYFASIDGLYDTTHGDLNNTFTLDSQSFNGGSSQSTLKYNFNNNSLTSPSITSSAFEIQRSFKAGATHDLGVVYYDKYNRSGNVNRIGSFYVDHFSERSSLFGSSYATVNFLNDAPNWAERYQIVYPGNSTYSSWTTYTAGGAFFEWKDWEDNTPTDPNDGKKLVYLSLNTLEQFKTDKGALLDYSFTPGDKLRVVSYDATASGTGAATPTFPSASDGGPIEFDVLGYTNLGDESRLHGAHTDATGVDPHEGYFLVLSAPAVSGGIDGATGGEIKYDGFDWFSITGEDYPDGTSPASAVNYWDQRCLVEILTPKVNTSEAVWYEIGEEYAVATRRAPGLNETNHGPPVVIGGSETFFKPTSVKTPYRTASNAYDLNLDDYRYETLNTESQRISDFFGDESWDRGRAHVVNESAGEIRRYNSITYSDKYVDDTSRLSLSSFNPITANFFDLNSAYGALRSLSVVRDNLIGIQENRVAKMLVEKTLFQGAQNSSIAALSNEVITLQSYFAGDYGCGDVPESVLVYDGQVFFADPSRSSIIRISNDQLYPISDKNMRSHFATQFADFNAYNGGGDKRVLSGYDPSSDMYCVTIIAGDTRNTTGYSVDAGENGRWMSRYSFTPDFYSLQNDTMFSSSWYDPTATSAIDQEIFWAHNNETRNNFYGVPGLSSITIVSNPDASAVKVYRSCSYEGDRNDWTLALTTDLGHAVNALNSGAFIEYEGGYYSPLEMSSVNSTSHVVGLGSVLSLSDSVIEFNEKVDRTTLPSNASIQKYDSTNGVLVSAGTNVVADRFVDWNKLEFGGTLTGVSVGETLVAVGTSVLDGDPARGHFATITMTNNATNVFELYCVNMTVVESKNNHRRQQ